jgi:hypothetical protein
MRKTVEKDRVCETGEFMDELMCSSDMGDSAAQARTDARHVAMLEKLEISAIRATDSAVRVETEQPGLQRKTVDASKPRDEGSMIKHRVREARFGLRARTRALYAG